MTKRLGKGLSELIDTGTASSGSGEANFVMLRTEQIRPGRFQPRESIEDASLEELKASIQRSGVIEPVVVRPIAHGTYELVAGERRFRATQAIGRQDIPAIIRTISDKEALEFSLIENIQRENLNPLEEAKGYARLLDEFGYTQEDIASAIGKDRATIANLLRILALPEEIQQGLTRKTVTLGHAKALLSLTDNDRQLALFHRVVQHELSVRQTETLAGAWNPTKRTRLRAADPQLAAWEDALRRALGTKVRLSARKKGGRIAIDYFSSEDLTRILHVLGVPPAAVES